MTVRAVEVRGLRELQRELRQIDPALARELRQVNLRAAELIVNRVHRANKTPQQTKAEAGVRAKAEQRVAKVAIGGARHPFAIGAYFGAKRFRQFPSHVGNTWTPGAATGGPYVIGDVMFRSTDELVDLYDRLIDDLTRRAFPDGST